MHPSGSVARLGRGLDHGAVSPTARFFICLSIKVSNSSKTADTSFLPIFVFFAISFSISVFVYFFCIAGAFLTADFLDDAVFREVLLTAMPNLF